MRGWLWILLLFAPWISYWVLCGFGMPIGVLAGLALSAALYAANPDKRSLMCLTALTFFCAASAATYVLGSTVFVEMSGFFGYAALFLMAIASIVVGKPYTYEVSKRDYPEVYWQTPEFVEINKAITLVWALVFLVSALISLLPQPISLASYGLVAVGIAFSAVYPLKHIEKMIRSKLPSYGDWEVDPSVRDVVIVGAGIGGLVCGALLAKRGYRVTVLEQHSMVGGYCTSFRRGGFVFDGGVESISGLGEKGAVRFVLRELGYDPDELFVKTREEYVVGGKRIQIPDDFCLFVDMLCERYPDEAENIKRFFEEVEAAYREMHADVDKTGGAPVPLPLIVKLFGFKSILDFPKKKPHFYKWMNKSLKQVLDEFFENKELKQLLSTLTAYLGTSPEETEAASMLAIYGYYIDGGYYPKGGSQAFANLLAKAVEENDGKVLTKRLVEKILVEDGEVVGVVADDEFFEASVVVVNSNVKNLLKMVDSRWLPKDFVEQVEKLRPSVTAFMVYLGVDADLSHYTPLTKFVDEGIGIVINSNLDPSLAPKGKSSVSIITLLPPKAYDEFEKCSTPEYLEKKKAFAQKLVEKAAKAIPELRERVEVMDAATPKTFERYTLNPKGAIYAFDQSMNAPKRPYFKTPVKGLYLVGASTFPGAGIEAVTISGVIAANDICRWGVVAQGS